MPALLRAIIRPISQWALVGAVINLLVAWALSCWLPSDDARTKYDPAFRTAQSPPCWQVMMGGSFGVRRAISSTLAATTGSTSQVHPAAWGSPARPIDVPRDSTRVIEQAAGWPMLSVWCGLEADGYGKRTSGGMTTVYAVWRTRPSLGGIALSTAAPEGGPSLYGVSLPLRPIWRGFAINTLCFACFAWLVWAGPGTVRRWRRRRRSGCCLACGYPIGESDVCTECGKPLPKRAIS